PDDAGRLAAASRRARASGGVVGRAREARDRGGDRGHRVLRNRLADGLLGLGERPEATSRVAGKTRAGGARSRPTAMPRPAKPARRDGHACPRCKRAADAPLCAPAGGHGRTGGAWRTTCSSRAHWDVALKLTPSFFAAAG